MVNTTATMIMIVQIAVIITIIIPLVTPLVRMLNPRAAIVITVSQDVIVRAM